MSQDWYLRVAIEGKASVVVSKFLFHSALAVDKFIACTASRCASQVPTLTRVSRPTTCDKACGNWVSEARECPVQG